MLLPGWPQRFAPHLWLLCAHRAHVKTGTHSIMGYLSLVRDMAVAWVLKASPWK